MYRYLYKDLFRENELIHVKRSRHGGVEGEHTHEFVEMVYILSGNGKHFIDNKCYEVGKGSLLFINYGQTHSFRSEHPLEYFDILIKPEFLADQLLATQNAFELLTLTAFSAFQTSVCTDRPLVVFTGEELLQVDRTILALQEEYLENRPGRDTIMKSYVTILLTYVFRKMSYGLHQGETARIPGEILEYMEEHFNERLTLNLLATKCFYNPKYFSSVFKDCYGMTVTDYIQRKRIEHGCKLLEETDLPVEEVSRRVGYDDSVRFYRYFKKICGVTPRVYRKEKTGIL